jgi:hypothetical protein
MSEAKNILVVANETVVGSALIEEVERLAQDGPVSVHVICPQNNPKHGYVIYDETVREAVENRLAMTMAQLEDVGVEATGEVMDPDPYAAIMDALGERDYDEIVISTHPETRSGWMRQNLITRVEQATQQPVHHVVVDLEEQRDEVKRTLVVANQTIGEQELIDQLIGLTEDEPRRFIVIAPQSGEDDEESENRLAATIKRLEDEGLEAMGQVTHPDPYTSIQNALEVYGADEIVISTFPETRSGWLRADLVERVRSATGKPVHHVVSGEQEEEREPEQEQEQEQEEEREPEQEREA